MAILIVRSRASHDQIEQMQAALGSRIKLAVDVERRLLAGGGEMHADCEGVLLEDGSAQKDVWGADWRPDVQTVEFVSFINIRPRDGNRSMEIQDSDLRQRIESVVRGLLESS